ncbi:hypothetical protein OG394_27225 [Kribbella sp. NBC_01245]|uniref:hypothetical protein n=1 Tax=Kribbella sp. NBC_01245 TaxID=2903578 RepID=UPI002E2D7EE4|nr:hypothetical protein [Kribbella sp. NBC_01245]
MTLTEARDLLRSELLATAAAAVPGEEGLVVHDPGPVDPGALFDGRGPATICTITVETGDPARTDAAESYVEAAAQALRTAGWDVEVPPVEAGHHRAAAHREGFDIAVHAFDSDWRLTLTGQTPDL